MASIGQIIFWSMIVLIFLCAGFLILLLAIAFSVSQGTVETTDPFPVGNLGQDVVLECTFLTKSASSPSNNVLITWEKEGLTDLVYQYKNNAAQLQQQSEQFRARTQLFTNDIAGGNASLLLRTVRMEDQGVYLCSVSAPGVWGKVSIDLRVGVYSAPQISKVNNSLKAVAAEWQPKPNVSWTDQNGNTLNSKTQFNIISGEIVQIESQLQAPLNISEMYTCVINNSLVQSISEVTGNGVLTKSYFLTNSSPKMLPLHIVGPFSFLLYMLSWQNS